MLSGEAEPELSVAVHCVADSSRLSDTTLLRFGPFEANTYTGELHKNGTRIKIAPQAFQILALLAGRPGELITREEIQRVVWPDETIVEFDHSINTAVKRIREALQDSRGEPQYIETLPRRGYRFIGPVERVERVPIPASPRQPAARSSDPSTRTSPVSARSRSRSVRAGTASKRKRHWFGLSSQIERSEFRKMKPFFSFPDLKLIRADLNWI